jgi:hypothetical protein
MALVSEVEIGTLARPWENAPNCLVSWWDMEKFAADTFFVIGRVLESLAYLSTGNDDAPLPVDSAVAVKLLPDLKSKCDAIGLRLSSVLIARTLRTISKGVTTIREWKAMIPEIQDRIQDEMRENLFMFIPPERASYYNKPELFGKGVNQKFPTIQYDVVEAGNCYASGRSTAAVFHSMRIMEVGVQQFGTKLGVALANEKNWQNILEEVNKAIKALDPKLATTKEFAAAAANLYSVKLAWRNEVMHPKDTYTLEEADNLIRQVKIFMEQLSQIV